MIELYLDEKDCCGCMACKNVCSRNAIKIEEKKSGLYPYINREECIECGACKRVCAFQKKNLVFGKEPLKVFAGHTRNINLIKQTASGGIFAELAEKIILSGGVVYGTVMDLKRDKYPIYYSRAETLNELPKMYGSKYVQSYFGDIYQLIKNDLENNKQVLLSGTPCQIAGIKVFLGKDYDNLLTIDLICHGVPDIQVFKDYIAFVEKKKKVKIEHLIFRDKTKGWGTNGKIIFCTKKGERRERFFLGKESSYYYFFLRGELYRKNCYNCPYAKKKRVGDLTIGDFWGVDREEPQYEKEEIRNGVSCILINTEKGMEKLKQYGENIKMTESSFDKVARWNGQLNGPAKRKSDIVLQLYQEGGYKKVYRYYLKSFGWKVVIRRLLGRLK